jgi:hypothetical protein
MAAPTHTTALFAALVQSKIDPKKVPVCEIAPDYETGEAH